MCVSLVKYFLWIWTALAVRLCFIKILRSALIQSAVPRAWEQEELLEINGLKEYCGFVQLEVQWVIAYTCFSPLFSMDF